MKKLVLAFLVAIIASCNSTDKSSEEHSSKMKEVIAIHDQVMPKMGTLARLARQLNEKMEVEGKNDEMEQAVKDLGDAKTNMMDWMRDFGGKFSADQILKGAEISDDEMKLLLEEEKEIIQVRDQILGSIERAEKLVAQE